MKPARWTVGDVLRWTTAYFRTKGIPSARLDSEVLLAHTLGVDRLHLYLNLDRPLLPEERENYRNLVRRRAGREPVALITGSKEFWSIPIRAVPGVLIPRPETETLVEIVLGEINANARPTILEVGTGSGAVALAVARERPGCRVFASDIDLTALSAAKFNAEGALVEPSVEFFASDLFSAIRPGKWFDVICSNPPYVPRDSIGALEPEIVRYEPRRALDGGLDGLDIIRALASEAGDFLKDGAALIFEIGDGQEHAVREILSAVGHFRDIRAFPDLAGKPRVVKARRLPP